MKKIVGVLFLLFCFGFLNSVQARRIGIISALPQEQEILKTALVMGKIGQHDVFLGLSGMGKVNAAMSAQKLISENKIDMIIFTGVAGGINKTYNIGDVIIASRAFQHDFGFIGDSFVIHAPGVIPEIGIGTGKEPIYFDLTQFWNSNVFDSINKSSQKFSKHFEKVKVNGVEYQPKLIMNGTVATGDQFIENNKKKDSLRDLQADLVEMEGASVVQVASQNKIPCLLIRSISDKAGEKASVDFTALFATVAKNNAHLAEYLLQNLSF